MIFNNVLNKLSDSYHTIMTLKENNISLKDISEVIKGKSTLLHGRVEMFDNETGELIFRKNNLVLLRGRTFALEKMFDTPNTLDMGYNVTDLASKKICLFKIGNGGADPANPFTLLAGVVNPNNTSLVNEIPFVISNEGEEKPEKYFDLKAMNDGTSNNAYFAKTFDSYEYFMNTNTEDEVGVKLTISLEPEDFATTPIKDENGYTTYTRSTFINEIGLCIGNVVTDSDGKMTDVQNVELISHLTFSSEPYTSPLKSSTVYYYLYA